MSLPQLGLFDIRNISEYISGMQVLGKLPIKAMDMFLRTKPIKPFCSYHVLNFWTSEGLRSYKLCSYKKKHVYGNISDLPIRRLNFLIEWRHRKFFFRQPSRTRLAITDPLSDHGPA